MWRDGDGLRAAHAATGDLRSWSDAQGRDVADHVTGLIDRIATPVPSFAGIALARPCLMGVVNVTPDSFSDGGDAFDAGDAVSRGRALAEAGAAIIDVGGESTRPGSDAVSEAVELRRVESVVGALAAAGHVVSIDTRRAVVMRAALAAGAKIVNDVTALTGDADSIDVVARSGAAVVLMHMQGEPKTMQAAPTYRFAPLDIYDYLADRIAVCEAAGITRDRIAIDPGIGFGKTLEHNLQILDMLGLFRGLGCAVLLGVSRKSFIAKLSGEGDAKSRLPGSIAAGLAGIARGVHILRVHDVAETLQALTVWQAIGARR